MVGSQEKLGAPRGISRIVGLRSCRAGNGAVYVPAARAASSADERATAFRRPWAIIILGAIVGIWQDGRELYVWGVRRRYVDPPGDGNRSLHAHRQHQ